MEIYLSQRQKKERKKLFKLVFFGCLGAFFVLAETAIGIIIYSPLFKVENVEINGNNGSINAEEFLSDINKVVENQSKIASFLSSKNMLAWNVNSDVLIKYLPVSIKEIEIKKDYAGRKIIIEIKPREKFGVWCSGDESISCMWFDNDGVLFAVAPVLEGNLINKVDDYSGRNLLLGDKIFETEFNDNLIKIFNLLEKTNLRIKSLTLKNFELREIETSDFVSPKIYFSLRIDPAFGLIAIETLKKNGLEKVDYINLTVPNKAFYKFK